MPVRFVVPRPLGELKANAAARLVAKQLSSAVDRWVEPVAVAWYEELRQRLLMGEGDVALVPPAVCASLETEARAIYKVVREGSSRLCGTLIARRGAGITIDGLKGGDYRAAWVDRWSTSGYLLPRALLRQRGLRRGDVFREEVFHGSHRDAALAVAAGEADVGAVFSTAPTQTAAETAFSKLLGLVGTELEPVAFTPESVSDAFVVMRSCPERLAEATIEMLERESPPANLREACAATRFERAERGEYTREAVSSSAPPPHEPETDPGTGREEAKTTRSPAVEDIEAGVFARARQRHSTDHKPSEE